MDIQPTNEAELDAVQLMDKQQRYKKLANKIEGLRFNSTVILIFPLLLSVIQFVVKSNGVDIDILFYGMMMLFVLLITWTNERIDLIYRLLTEQLQDGRKID